MELTRQRANADLGVIVGSSPSLTSHMLSTSKSGVSTFRIFHESDHFSLPNPLG